jgi:very-short-patch-repair endonuclease
MARAQHGVVSRTQLRGLGYSDGAVDRSVSAGRLHRIHRGVYAVGHTQLSPHGQCRAALLACGPQALLSHSSAAWLWGLRPQLVVAVEVTVPRRGHGRKTIRIHHIPSLRKEDRAESEGLPVTAVPRTLLDLASTSHRKRLERDLNRAERLGIFNLAAIDELLARAGRHPGIAKLRSALELHREPAFTQSGLERLFLRLVRDSGLPMPSANVFVEGFQLDMYWERERFAVELDGYEFHSDRDAFERDRRRPEDLKLAGIEMVRFTARRVVDHPDEVMRRVAALLGQRRGELSGRSTAGTG